MKPNVPVYASWDKLIDFAANKPLGAEQLSKRVQRALEEGVDHGEIGSDVYFQLATKRLLDEFYNELDMYAPSTQKRLKSAWAMFFTYCERCFLHPLPSSSKVVCDYLDERKALHRNTLNVDLWAIKLIHLVAGCPDPTAELKVKNKMRALIRHKVRVEEEVIKQAPPFKEVHLDRLTDIWGKSNNLTELRNVTLLSIAYETLLRSAEIVNIKIRHIQQNKDGSGALEIPFTKTNQSGEGSDYAYISPFVMTLISSYLANIGSNFKSDGYLFSPLSRFGRLRPPMVLDNGSTVSAPLSTRTIADIFLEAWYVLNPDMDRSIPLPELKEIHRQRPFTPHSARVGAAQDLLEKGFDDLQLRQAGRWKSNTMPSQYSQHIKVSKSAMALSRNNRR